MPAWKLTALVLAVVGAFVFFGLVPALVVVGVFLLAEMIIGLVRRNRQERGKP